MSTACTPPRRTSSQSKFSVEVEPIVVDRHMNNLVPMLVRDKSSQSTPHAEAGLTRPVAAAGQISYKINYKQD